MAELKTRSTDASVTDFIGSVEDDQKRQDCLVLLGMMEQITGARPKMWGDSIVGFGQYHYIYGSGREGDWFLTGFSPRRQNLSVYIMAGFDRYAALMQRLGRHKTGKSCLYIRRLDDIALEVLRELVAQSLAHLSRKNSRDRTTATGGVADAAPGIVCGGIIDGVRPPDRAPRKGAAAR